MLHLLYVLILYALEHNINKKRGDGKSSTNNHQYQVYNVWMQLVQCTKKYTCLVSMAFFQVWSIWTCIWPVLKNHTWEYTIIYIGIPWGHVLILKPSVLEYHHSQRKHTFYLLGIFWIFVEFFLGSFFRWVFPIQLCIYSPDI